MKVIAIAMMSVQITLYVALTTAIHWIDTVVKTSTRLWIAVFHFLTRTRWEVLWTGTKPARITRSALRAKAIAIMMDIVREN